MNPKMEEELLPSKKNRKFFKVVFVGNSSTGKTCIIKSFLENGTFKEDQTPTIALNFFQKEVTFGEETVILNIWDTAGQERFKSFSKMYFRGASGAFITFDLSNKSSFLDVPLWFKKLESEVNKGCKIILLGNKADLKENRSVKRKEIEELQKKLNASYFETSAKLNLNLKKAFQQLVEKMMQNYEPSDDRESKQYYVELEEKKPIQKQKLKSSCCGSNHRKNKKKFSAQ